ncbi:hypothetical protein ACQEVM_36670 [Streptomyces sp. CA-243310]|uniref:hypothetical protein n=1 Tax=Streptomyces sp. CA-243310 TaxID=3240056 RepID=UPI003D916296
MFGTLKYFYEVPYRGLYVDGNDIVWDTKENTAVPARPRLESRHSGKAMEIGSQSSRSDAPVLPQEWHNTANQKFRPAPSPDARPPRTPEGMRAEPGCPAVPGTCVLSSPPLVKVHFAFLPPAGLPWRGRWRRSFRLRP